MTTKTMMGKMGHPGCGIPTASYLVDLFGDRWLTAAAAADTLGVDPDQIHRLMEKGTLVGRMAGEVWLIRLDSVQRLLDLAVEQLVGSEP